MNIRLEDAVEEILDHLDQLEYIHPSDIPDIGMYMDQVTTFMDARLSKARRTPEDKMLTKTMINNYTKHKLLPPPEGKKYSREHLLILLFIYYYKGTLSLQDIRSLLSPLRETYFQNENGPDITTIYEEILQDRKDRVASLKQDIYETFQAGQSSFTDAPEKDQEFLRIFHVISSLVLDVYLKRHVIEQLIDHCLKDF